MRRRTLAGSLALLLSGAVKGQTPSNRIALVIGNTEYKWRTPLDNAVADANSVSRELGRLDFKVRVHEDLSKPQLDNVLIDFGSRLRSIGTSAISFFYYSGHAAQDATQTNYLIPTDARANAPEQLRNEASTLTQLFVDMNVANNDVNIVVLDACRDWFHDESSVKIVKGLHDVGRQGNMFIAMATSPNKVAEDSGNNGSPFSRRVVEALRQRPQPSISQVFDDVLGKVYSDTQGNQAPEYINGMARAPRWTLGSPVEILTKTFAIAPPVQAISLPIFLQNLSRERLIQLTYSKTSVVEALLARRDLLAVAGLINSGRLAYFLGTISYETAGFRLQSEKLSYPSEMLRRLFSRKFPTDEIAQEYAFNPEKIANRIYSNMLGNGPESSGDGWKFRGRGYFMITGRANYQLLERQTGVDLVNAPDLINDPEINLAAALAYWANRKVNDAVDTDDRVRISRILYGLAPRPNWISEVDRAKTVLGST